MYEQWLDDLPDDNRKADDAAEVEGAAEDESPEQKEVPEGVAKSKLTVTRVNSSCHYWLLFKASAPSGSSPS